MTEQQVREVNEAIGLEAFRRLYMLSDVTLEAFASALTDGDVNLHQDGMVGFTVQVEPEEWSNEGFERGGYPSR